MVKLKYSALYTDNYGCERAEVYFSEDGLKLKVRNFIFEDNHLNFDFYSKNQEEIKHLFNLKEDELVEYIIEIKIPMILTYNKEELIKEFLLSIKRDKNYYNNSLSCNLNDDVYKVEGYDLKQLLKKMKNELSKEYNMESNFLSLSKVYCINQNNERSSNILEGFDEKVNILLSGKYDLKLVDIIKNSKYESFEKIPIKYICNKYCLS